MASSAPAGLAHTIWDPDASAPHPLHPRHCSSTSRMEGCPQNAHWPFICSPGYPMLQRRLCAAHLQAIWFVSPQRQVYQVCLVFLWKPPVKLNAMTCFKPVRGSSPGGHFGCLPFPQRLLPCPLPLQVQVATLVVCVAIFRIQTLGWDWDWTSGRVHVPPHWYILLPRKS